MHTGGMNVDVTGLKDLAQVLNLSTGTVSRALNGRGNIAQKTRDIVAQTAAELNYIPKRRTAGKSDSLQRIGVCIGNPCLSAAGTLDPSFVGLHYMVEMERAASAVKVAVQVGFIDAMSDGHRLDQLPVFQSGDIQGTILVYPFPESFVKQLAVRGPVVSIEHTYPTASIDTVGPAQSRDAMAAVQYLYDLGHRSIAYVCDEDARGHKLTMGLRHAGYVSGLMHCGLVYEPDNVANVYSPIVAKANLSDWVVGRMQAGVTAIITSISRHGYILWEQLQARGIGVPNELSIVAIGGVHRAKGLPQLTTWRCSYDAIAATAIDALRARRSGRRKTDLYQEVASVFVQGQSCGAPR